MELVIALFTWVILGAATVGFLFRPRYLEPDDVPILFLIGAAWPVFFLTWLVLRWGRLA